MRRRGLPKLRWHVTRSQPSPNHFEERQDRATAGLLPHAAFSRSRSMLALWSLALDGEELCSSRDDRQCRAWVTRTCSVSHSRCADSEQVTPRVSRRSGRTMHRSCAELIRYRKDLARPAPFECVCALIWQARCQKTHSMARDLRLSDTWRGGEKAFGRILRLLSSAPHRVTVEVPLSRLGSMRTHHGGRSLQGVLQATGKEQVSSWPTAAASCS